MIVWRMKLKNVLSEVDAWQYLYNRRVYQIENGNISCCTETAKDHGTEARQDPFYGEWIFMPSVSDRISLSF